MRAIRHAPGRVALALWRLRKPAGAAAGVWASAGLRGQCQRVLAGRAQVLCRVQACLPGDDAQLPGESLQVRRHRLRHVGQRARRRLSSRHRGHAPADARTPPGRPECLREPDDRFVAVAVLAALRRFSMASGRRHGSGRQGQQAAAVAHLPRSGDVPQHRVPRATFPAQFADDPGCGLLAPRHGGRANLQLRRLQGRRAGLLRQRHRLAGALHSARQADGRGLERAGRGRQVVPRQCQRPGRHPLARRRPGKAGGLGFRLVVAAQGHRDAPQSGRPAAGLRPGDPSRLRAAARRTDEVPASQPVERGPIQSGDPGRGRETRAADAQAVRGLGVRCRPRRAEYPPTFLDPRHGGRRRPLRLLAGYTSARYPESRFRGFP